MFNGNVSNVITAMDVIFTRNPSLGAVVSRVKVVKSAMDDSRKLIDFFRGAPVACTVDAGFTNEYLEALSALETALVVFNREQSKLNTEIRKNL